MEKCASCVVERRTSGPGPQFEVRGGSDKVLPCRALGWWLVCCSAVAAQAQAGVWVGWPGAACVSRPFRAAALFPPV